MQRVHNYVEDYQNDGPQAVSHKLVTSFGVTWEAIMLTW